MKILSARWCATLFAVSTLGVASCDSVKTTEPAATALAAPHSGTADLVSQTYTSGSNVTAWDAIVPATGDPNWPTSICTNSPAVGLDANWQNPHPAYVLYGHPWAYNYFNAPWINAYNSLGSIGPLGQSWTKYQTTVSGNGSFVIRLLADNCSWVYLDGTLVGVQGTDLDKNSYGLTLNGTHTLTFIIFDGGGANGGKFRLETTTNPPPPLNPDLDGDGVANESDNCSLTANPDQSDIDHDGIGDACDPDIDGDGVANADDAYPTDPTRSAADATAPSITPTVTGDLGAGGWYTSDVNVSWTVTDGESPVTSPACAASSVTADTNDAAFTCTATSAGGTATQTVHVKRDATKPTITAVVTGTQGLSGWYTSDVGISWTVSGNGPSGATSSCAASTLSSDTNGQAYDCTATSGAGLSSSASVTVKRDASKPTVTAIVSGTEHNGWYTSDVVISWSAVSNGPSGGSSSCAVSTLSTDTPGALYSCTATSGAGLTSSASKTVKRDATNPTIGYTGNAGVYALDQTVSITCSYGDAMSGVASQSCANVYGAAYTFGLGPHTYSASVTDNAGNTNSAATTFTVRATPASLCTMTRQFVTGPGEAGVENSLCGKLDKGNYAPYINEVQAQSGKKISASNATLLILWAQSL